MVMGSSVGPEERERVHVANRFKWMGKETVSGMSERPGRIWQQCSFWKDILVDSKCNPTSECKQSGSLTVSQKRTWQEMISPFPICLGSTFGEDCRCNIQGLGRQIPSFSSSPPPPNTGR